MRESPVRLWRVELADESVFFILGCCLDEALARAYDSVDADDDIVGIAVAEGPLVVDDEDDDEGEDDELLPPAKKNKFALKTVQGRN